MLQQDLASDLGLSSETALNICINPSKHAVSFFGLKLMKGEIEMNGTGIAAASVGM